MTQLCLPQTWEVNDMPDTQEQAASVCKSAEKVTVSADDLAKVLDLYHQGLYLQAYRLAETFGPLRQWTGAPGRVMAGRLAYHLGSPRLAMYMHYRAYREDPEDPEARYYNARALLERRGPLRAWQFLKKCGPMRQGPAEIRSDWLAFHACVLGRLRDFDAAETWLAQAENVCPEHPWTYIERSALLELEDRYEESLAAARLCLERHPWYRPAVQAVAHGLQLLDRDREALELLTESAKRIESGPLVAFLAVLQTELGLYAEARKSYERLAELSPLMDKELSKWVAARRSDAAYYCGDYAEAARFAREVQDPCYDKIAERLAQSPLTGRHVQLDVSFVRQHFQTCVPATLTAIARFWKMPAEHLEVAAAICYDGTPDHRERAWAEEHGWTTREFTISWDSTVALIDRGVPFSLTTAEAGNAHMQGVIGYDSCRGTLIVREPSMRYFNEFMAETLLEKYRSVGPRGMALVPREQAHLLADLDLPDAPLYDQLYQVQRALQVHDRTQAVAVYETMKTAAPDHRLTWQARRVLAMYDADPSELLASIEGLLKLFPEDELLSIGKIACLRELARRDERMALLQTLCERKNSSPIFWRQYAQELMADAREHEQAHRWLRRALRYRPYDGANLATMANLLWDRQRFEEALELYRFAACFEDKDESLARSYFSAARYLKQTEETLRFLQKRFERFGKLSSQPARTLYWAYSQFERLPEALVMLDEAMKLRPNDGELLVFAAESYCNSGKFDRAAELLTKAEGICQRTTWLRTAANLSAIKGELAAALQLWQQVLDVEPLALDANRAVAQLLAETVSRARALDHLEQACERFPHNYALHQLWIGWLREEGAARAEPVIRRLIAIHPVDGWARRELAICLSDQGRHEEAKAELALAYELEPNNTAYFAVLGQLCERTGRMAEAQEAYRQAIRLSVDNDYAIGRLIEICETLATRREALAFVESELIRQVIYGDGLLAYQQHAQYTLEPEELLASLRKALDARPDLWHAWSALIRQLVELGRLEEALELARQATAKFPLLPRLWLDLASVCQAMKDQEGEISALRQALQINPAWGNALRRLAEIYAATDRLEQARTLMEQGIASTPLDPVNHGYLADILWQQGNKEAAVERIQQALRLAPAYEWAWNNLQSWSRELGRPELALQCARQLTEERPNEANSWLWLAKTLDQPSDLGERLHALDRAIALAPHSTDAYDFKAYLLAQSQRYEEALAVCNTLVWDHKPPLTLCGRAAWIEAQRGNLAEAVKQIRSTLEEDPNYYWGWSNLADWLRELNANAEYLAAAEQMVRLAPQNAMVYGYRGEARLRLNDRQGARQDFQRAMEISPGYQFAGLSLFDEQMNGGELDAAARTLEVLKKHANDELVTARVVQLAAQQGDRDTARNALIELTESKSDTTWPLDSATAAMTEARWGADVDRVLVKAMESPTVCPCVGAVWARRCIERREWNCLDRLEALLQRGEVGKSALRSCLESLARARQRKRVHRLIRRFRKQLASDTQLWGTAGYALASIEAYRDAASWMKDWRNRNDLQPWMLLNLSIALRGTGNDAEAYQAALRAVKLPPDHTTKFHRIWLMLDEAIGESWVSVQGGAGIQSAANRLGGIDCESLDNYHRFLFVLASQVLAVRNSGEADRSDAFSTARRNLWQAAAECSPVVEDRSVMIRAYRRAVSCLARERGGFWAKLWAFWCKLEPGVPKRA